MSKAAASRKAAEARCVRELREAGRCDSHARFCRDNDMPRAALVWSEMARDAEQRAEAELHSLPPRPDLDERDRLRLRPDYEARLDDYLARRASRFGPITQAFFPESIPPKVKMWLGGDFVAMG